MTLPNTQPSFNYEYYIRYAADRADITLTRDDFTVTETDIYIDGMDPADWVDAMMMD